MYCALKSTSCFFSTANVEITEVSGDRDQSDIPCVHKNRNGRLKFPSAEIELNSL